MPTIALILASPALATVPSGKGQAASEKAPEPAALSESDVDAIVVTAERLRGQVVTDAAPVLELEEKQIAAYGATSIADLVAELAPQVGAGQGRGGQPVFLVNGQRISSFREMGRYPPEAVRKVEVLPEQVAVKFGYPPDQRVINFILKDNFSSKDIELELGQPIRGGYSTVGGSASRVAINGPSRTTASLEYKTTSPLTEAERGLVQAAGQVPGVPGDPNPASFRTLVARATSFTANATRTTGLGEGGSDGQFTLNGNYARNTSLSFSGLDTVVLTGGGTSVLRVLDANPLGRRTATDTFSLGSGLNKSLTNGWRFSTTLDASLGLSETLIDRRRDTAALVAAAAAGTLAPGGPLPSVTDGEHDTASSRTYTIDSLTTLVGALAELPAGEFGATLSGGLKFNGIRSEDTRTVGTATELDRRRVRVGVDLTLPIASRRAGVLAGLGDLQFSIGGDLENLSDFGMLRSWNAGLNWKAIDRLTVQASYRMREVAPTLTQLGGPAITQLNVPTLDFTTGRTVLVATTTGGNPLLASETQRDIKLSANYDLGLFDRTNMLVEYYRNRSDNVTSGFPLLTPAIEAAFPGRVTRDASGELTTLDARYVTFARTRSARLRYGFNLSGRIGSSTSARQAAGPIGGGRDRMGMSAPSPTTTTSPIDARLGSGRPAGAVSATDPQRFAAMREKFCATPEGQMPDLSGLPEALLARFKGDDGQLDPTKVALMRQRFCSADAPRRFDPARFAAMRQALCADPAKAPDPASIPDEVRDRLKGPNGSIAPERLKEFQSRICALPVAQGAQAGREGGEQRRDGGASSGIMSLGQGRDGQGRWNLSIYHTINLANSVLVAPGGPFLDLLGGGATGSNGGISRHQFEFEGGAFYRGIGIRLSGNLSTATNVAGSGGLRFGSLATVNLRSFVALDQQSWLVGQDPGFFKQARLSLRIDNLFASRQRVSDANGSVPLRYQPSLIDPVGRFVELEFRKLF